MPFDGKAVAPITTALRAVLGPNGEHWCRGTLRQVLVDGRIQYCLVGAILAVSGDPECIGTGSFSNEQLAAALALVHRALPHGYASPAPQGTNILGFNDSRRDWREVGELLDRVEAIEISQSQEG